MESRLKLKPGQKGRKRLVEIYGDSLVCVRYRYDAVEEIRLKTVELVIEKKPWKPPQRKFADETRVPVRIAYSETELKALAKNAGGRWNPDEKVWYVPYGKIRRTALEKHIVLDAEPIPPGPKSI
jgi:hypothetical protein